MLWGAKGVGDFEFCKNILIADDNDGVREALIAALKARGYDAVGARNGKDAIAKLSALDGPTLIFLDLMMPVLDGWEVLKVWNKDPNFARNPVVTISAVNLSSRLDARVPQNTVGRLQKPLTFKSVYELVKTHCGARDADSKLSPTATQNANP